MDKAFDSLAAYRKLGESGMPEPQATATVEVVSDAMRNLVTKEYLTAELDRRFAKVDERFAKVDAGFMEMGRRQAWGFVYMSVFFIGLATLFLTAQQHFVGRAAGQPVYSVEPDAPPAASDSRIAEPANESPPGVAQ